MYTSYTCILPFNHIHSTHSNRYYLRILIHIFIHQILRKQLGCRAKPIMLHQYFKSHCIRIYRWFVYLETRFYYFVPTSIALGRIFNVVGSVIDRYSEVPYFALFTSFSSSYVIEFTNTHCHHNYLSSIPSTNNHKDFIFYSICLFIQTDHTQSPAPFQLYLSLFYSLDVHFALSKPIHRNPPHITSLSISVRLFETGIKVINLLTPYKKGGKIGQCWCRHGVN